MAEPGDAVRVDDVENSSDDEEEDEEESSTGSDENSTEESSSEVESEEESSDGDGDDDSNVWDSVDDGAQTEEAVEASLQADYTKALNLIVDGRKQKAFAMMKKLLQHPILQKFEVNINLFNWNEARKEACANQSRALTVYPNDEYLWKYVGEESLKVRDWSMALYAFRNCSSVWSVIRGILIALYNANLFEDCLLKIKSVLEYDKTYFLGRVLKEIIRETNSYWEMRCRQIFNEDPALVQDEDVMKITKKEKEWIVNEIANIGRSTANVEPVFRPIVVELGICSNLAEIGVYLCDIYDRIESFSSFSKQSVVVCSRNLLNEFEEVVHDVSNDLIDCVNVIQDLIDRIVSVEVIQPASSIRKQSDSGLDWRRRSVRFRAEFNIEESGSENEKILIASLLNYSCAQESSIVPLMSMKPSSMADLPARRAPVYLLIDDRTSLRRCVVYLASKFMDENGRIFEILEQLLFWYSRNCFCIVITDHLREVIIGCYIRWITNFGNTSMICGDGLLPIHTMLSELGSEKAMFLCYSSLSSSLEQELRVRILWSIAVNGTNTFPFQVCKNHIWLLLTMLKSGCNSKVKYQSLISGHELITLETVQNLIAQMERRESLEAIQRLFDNRHFDKVVDIIIDNFSWKDVDRSALLSTATILIDSYLELNDMDGASEWISRLLDFTGGFAGTEEVITRLKRLVIERICLENISNLVHCIVHLLVLGGYESDTDLWLILYRCAYHLEGEYTVETLSTLYDGGCQMLTSALNILVTAHEAIAKHNRCFVDDHSFPLFVLNEFSKIRAHPAVVEILSTRECIEQSRAFIDEVHQCLFCLYGCPSRRKRQLEEHGGTHNHEPSLKDIENVLSLLLPDKIPPYDGTCCFDLIEFVQKKASSFLEPTENEKEKLFVFDRFIAQAEVRADWPRCAESSPLRSGVFYQLALHSYRSHKVDDAVQYAKLFLLCASATLPKEVFFWDWTVLAFAATSVFFTESFPLLVNKRISTGEIQLCNIDNSILIAVCNILRAVRPMFLLNTQVDEDEMSLHFDCSVFSFRMALFFDPSDRYVIFNFGSALYQINSRIRRYRDKLSLDDIRHRWADRRIKGLLEESRRQFETCISRLPDGDVDKWRCHYFLAKIAEKCGDTLEDVFHHYRESALQLEVAGVQYPSRINTKRQEHVEAIEIHYRAYASLLKYLLERATDWNREDLMLMHAFALCFRSHGVCKQKDSDELWQCPQVKAVISSLRYRCTEPADTVQGVLEDLIERTALKLEILHLCEEAFNICIRRFPHFKSYYRLSQLALYKGDVREASNYLFGRFLVKKKANFNPDNIFENVITISCKDIDRGDALQYHLGRISALAIYLSALLDDFKALATLIHTFCTLDFCNNTDYLLKRDLIMLYRNGLTKFLDCIQRKIKNNAVESQLLCSVYDLYQYAGRNNVQRLCERLRPVIILATKELAGYDEKIEPILFCKQLYIASKRKLGKRKLSGSSTTQAKSFRPFSSPNSSLTFI
uniref:TPR_REGION domain-containing protein n=1 Tax=Loa loa TaxID=7209 RepID=A0A1I7VE04_LOALO